MMPERKKAFTTIKQTGLFKLSVSFSRIIVGLWRLLMKGALNSPEMEGITPDYVIQLGREWFESMVDVTPDEELASLPKFEHLLVQKLQDGRQEGKAETLLRQLTRRFGTLPSNIQEKVNVADLETLELWSDLFVDARSLEDVFGSDININ
ncbi:MAG: DUF4351 domain-containing protein [Magnetococcus sp. DMHC-6]